jgi:hypothetical protein
MVEKPGEGKLGEGKPRHSISSMIGISSEI